MSITCGVSKSGAANVTVSPEAASAIASRKLPASPLVIRVRDGDDGRLSRLDGGQGESCERDDNEGSWKDLRQKQSQAAAHQRKSPGLHTVPRGDLTIRRN